MPEYLSPAVYVEEVSSGLKPIEGVGTSTGAFIGVAEKGPIGGAEYEEGEVGRPVLVTSFLDFTRTFGGLVEGEYLAYAVQHFFGEGGTRCYVTRTAHFNDVTDPKSLTAKRASYIFGPDKTSSFQGTLPAAGVQEAQLQDVTGIEEGTVLTIAWVVPGTDPPETTELKVTVTKITPGEGGAAPKVAFDPAIPAGTSIPDSASISWRQRVLTVNALNEGKWGNNLRVSLEVEGRVETKLKDALAQDKISAKLQDVSGIDIGTQLFIRSPQSTEAGAPAPVARLVQVTRVNRSVGEVVFRDINGSGNGKLPEIQAEGEVLGINPGKASTGLAKDAPAGALDVELKSAAGIELGSILLFRWGNTKEGEVAERYDRVVVNRLVGNRVFFAPALSSKYPVAGTSVSTEEFALVVYDGDTVVETHPGLSMASNNLVNYVQRRINTGATRSRYVRVEAAPTTDGELPDLPQSSSPVPLTGGLQGSQAEANDYIGSDATQTGFYAFNTIDDINIMVAPLHKGADSAFRRQVILEGMTYCENRADCFFVGDVDGGARTVADVLEFKNGAAGEQAINSTFGALYWPWVRVLDLRTGRPMAMPPSGAVAGSYSATDVRRGVHKAPAGTIDGFLNTVVGIEKVVTMGEHDVLNPRGVNVIRSFPDQGILIWGARTTTTDPEWRYVNVRRFFLFVEESIDEGTQWVVFEPNGPTLWAQITRNVSAFLRVLWLQGMLAGTKPEEGFFVKCDAETNPQESVDLGRVITIVGIAPLKPAEFVIFRIMQIRPGETGG